MSVHSLQDIFIKAVSSDKLQLPAFPAVAMKLQRALHDRNTRIADLEAMIIGDQALSSQILRVANSSFYKGLQKITTIQKAIVRLGVRQVAMLTMAVSQRSLYLVRNPRLGQYMEKLWQHAFASGLGAQWLAQRCGYQALAVIRRWLTPPLWPACCTTSANWRFYGWLTNCAAVVTSTRAGYRKRWCWKYWTAPCITPRAMC